MTNNQKRPTQVTRLINGALIIGKTYTDTHNPKILIIQDPWTIIPTQEELQMFPFDKDVLGVTLKEVKLDLSQTMYSQEPTQELSNLYLTNLSGIEIEPKKEILLG